jgi:PKD repeat protein
MKKLLPLYCQHLLSHCWRSAVLLSLFFLMGYQSHATCNLTAAWTYTTHGDTVYFVSSDTNSAAHHFWNFGDGNTGTGISASHVYPNYGVYHVCFYDYIPNTTCSDSLCQNVTLTAANPCAGLTAAWTYSNNSGDTVHFYAIDTASHTQYYWTFGDGVTGTSLDPVHVYAAPGTYHVCFHIYLNSCADSFCSTITVGTPCHITSAWTESINGDTVHFISADTNSTAHHFWNFGDGSTASGTTATHIYAIAGTYHVCFYDYIPGTACSDSFCNTVTIGAGCNITAAWTYTTHGDTIFVTASGTNTTAHHYWNFGDGTILSGYSVTHVYTSPGTYHVCQFVYIPNTTCSDSSCNSITITSTCNVNAAWQSYTIGDSVHFYAADTSTSIYYDWNFGDGTYGAGRLPWHTYTTPGTYHVCLYAYHGTNCIDSFCSNVTVAGGCNITASWTYTTHGDSAFFVSSGNNTTAHYTWNFGDGTTGSGYSANHYYTSPGTYHVCHYVYIPNSNCYDSSCNTIIVTNGCTLNAAWQSFTHGDTVNFYAVDTNSAAHHIWNYGDGTYGNGITSTHGYTIAGTYHVCLFVYIPGSSCTDSFCNTVVVGSGCHVNAGWSYTSNLDTAHFTAVTTDSLAHHYWTFDDGSGASGTTVSHTYLQPGIYYVCQYVYIIGTTCTDSSCNTITIANTNCNVNAAWYSYTIGDSVHFYASDTAGNVQFIWHFGDGTTGSGRTPWHKYTQSGTYHVCVTAYTGTNCIDTFCNNVVIGTGCTLSSAWSYTVYGDSVHFVGTDTTSAAHHIWVFSDGTYTTGLSASHTFSGPGAYHVCYYVYLPNTTCSDSTCNTILVDSACNTNAAWQFYAHGDTVYFYATDTSAGVHYDWNAGDGNYLFGTHPSHIYAQGGTYHVCLYAYVNNCLDSFCSSVTVGTGCNVNATWSYTIHGDTVTYVAVDTSTSAHHIWNFGDGSTGSGITITHVYPNYGTYHVCFYDYVPYTTCSDSSCNNITILDSCAANAAWQFYAHGDTAYFYASDTNTTMHYYWNAGDGSTLQGIGPSHIYIQPGTYHVCLYVYKPGTNCMDSFCNTIVIGSGCNISSAWTYTAYGDSVYFTGSGNNTTAHYYWTFGDGSSGSGYDATHVYTAPGTYEVCHYVYIPGSNCFDSTCNTITIAGACSLTAAWNFIHGNGDTFHFYALIPDSNAYVVWIFGDGTTSSGSYVIHSYPLPGTYYVCVHAYIPGTPCTDSACIEVTVGDSCAVTAAWTSITRQNDSIQFYALDPDTNAHHIWSFGDGTNGSGSYAAHTYATGGTYHVCLYVYIPGTTCSDSVCQDVNSALGIGNIGSYPTVRLSPNPFSQYAILNIDGPASSYDVNIYDMVGQQVRTIRSTNNSILIERGSLSPGIYVYEVIAGDMIIGKGKMSVE